MENSTNKPINNEYTVKKYVYTIAYISWISFSARQNKFNSIIKRLLSFMSISVENSNPKGTTTSEIDHASYNTMQNCDPRLKVVETTWRQMKYE